jgi:replicative DNA helicase
VLGGILLENQAMNIVVETLSVEDFYSEANAKIFEAMTELSRRGQPVDQVTLREVLVHSGKLGSVGGDEYLLSLSNTIPSVSNIQAHARIIREKSVIRALILACHEVVSRGYGDYGPIDEFLDQSESSIFAVGRERARNPYEHVKDVVIIVAGRPGMGKTSFALNVAHHACERSKSPVAVFSLEMPKGQLVRRLLGSEARVDGNRIRTGQLQKDDWPKLADAAGTLSEMPIWIDDTPAITMLELRAKARRLKSEVGLSLIVVDYLQLMRSGSRNDSREQEISEISRSLKALAKELEMPVIALSQLNRGVESRGVKDKRPQLSDLRESGAIEQDADTIWFIYRDEVYNQDSDDRGIAEIIIGKQRAGPTGTCRVRFFNEYTRFDDLAESDYYSGQAPGAADFRDN